MAWVIVMYNLIALIVGYLFGNILCAFIVCKIKFGINPTQIGSHNPGTANVVVFLARNGVFSPVISLLIYSIVIFVIYSNCAGILFLIGWCVMLYKFRNDLVAYCKGEGKRTDILFLFKRVLKHK